MFDASKTANVRAGVDTPPESFTAQCVDSFLERLRTHRVEELGTDVGKKLSTFHPRKQFKG
jgi:hypothetical protein